MRGYFFGLVLRGQESTSAQQVLLNVDLGLILLESRVQLVEEEYAKTARLLARQVGAAEIAAVDRGIEHVLVGRLRPLLETARERRAFRRCLERVAVFARVIAALEARVVLVSVAWWQAAVVDALLLRLALLQKFTYRRRWL